MNIDFVDFNEIILNKSFEWLQDSELCKLIDAAPISREKQIEWYNGLKTKTDYYIKGVLLDSKPIGAVGIKHIHYPKGEYWGYIGEKQYWGKGIGKEMILRMILDARNLFDLSKLYLRVDEDNIRAIRLYNSMGFIEVLKNGKFVEMELTL